MHYSERLGVVVVVVAVVAIAIAIAYHLSEEDEEQALVKAEGQETIWEHVQASCPYLWWELKQ
jgi:hypothetical protein